MSATHMLRGSEHMNATYILRGSEHMRRHAWHVIIHLDRREIHPAGHSIGANDELDVSRLNPAHNLSSLLLR